MSQINDLIRITKGICQILEAGVKFQQENASLVWNNSSFKPFFHNCATNIFHSNPDIPKDLFDRALVVFHGVRQYAVMQVPNFSPTPDKDTMDSQLQDEIEQLNREFDKTFENLKRKHILPGNVTIPLENFKVQAEKLKLKTIETPKVLQPSLSETEDIITNTEQSRYPVSKPVAKKKLKVSVGIFSLCII